MLSTNQKGAIVETAFTAAAVKLGLQVYLPAVEGGRYDLILDIHGRLLRVQCKWGTLLENVVSARLLSCRRAREGLRYRGYTADEIDAVGIYCQAIDKCFLIPPALFEGKRQVCLRLAPSRNNQRQSINWATEYELGAIAQLGERSAGSRKVVGSSPTSSTSEATAPAVASLFEATADPDAPPGDSSIPLRPSRRLPIIRAKC